MTGTALTLSAVAFASAVSFAYQTPPAGAPVRTNTVFVSVTEETGAPVTDLTAEDFTVKEDGKDREIVRVSTASEPLQVMIIVDDNGTGLFRSGLVQFVQSLQGRAEIAVSTVYGQTHRLVDYTPRVDTVVEAIVTLSARPSTPDGGQLLEGIFQASRDQQKRGGTRPVIVALTVGGEEHSTVPAHQVLDQLAQSRTTLYVIQVASSVLRPTVPITQSRQLLGENLNLSEVLGEGPKQTGGWRDEIVAATGIVGGLRRLSTELKSQYALAYARPPKSRSTERLNVGVKRRGVTLRAPTKVSGR
jgi:Ca-activated chloride channel homolog